MNDHVLPKTLSKSRFKLALECPRKVAYTSDARYVNEKAEDELLQALADGGHQIGALAKLMYAGGTEITANTIEAQLAETEALLERDSVTLFEATFQAGALLARVDVLVKEGNDIQLIEVKSKGFNPVRQSFRGAKGQVLSDWAPYLYDVAFQALVLNRARPEWRVQPYLMLVDTTAQTSVDGLGAKFRIERVADGRHVNIHVEPGFDAGALSPPLLRAHDVSAEVALLRTSPVDVPGGPTGFEEFVDGLAARIAAGRVPEVAFGVQCRRCEYYADPAELVDEQRSGWRECMEAVHGFPVPESRSQTVFALSNCRYLAELLTSMDLTLHRIADNKIRRSIVANEISMAHRHLLQLMEARGGAEGRHLAVEALRVELGALAYPVHFIDFETARPMLPYHRGHTPSMQLLFQFSHHILDVSGRLRHKTQCLVAEPGVPPSIATMRALRAALGETEGSVVHWWDHERTVLKDLVRQIAVADEPDRDELLVFIESLIGKDGSRGRLFDLGRLVLRTAFFEGTEGRSSIKKVLPAVMKQSALLRSRFGVPVYGTSEMPSLNYTVGKAWWVERDGVVLDPYELLGPLFADVAVEKVIEQGAADDGGSFVANGGAAMVAYGDLQRRDLPETERQRLREQLLKYCELDTLAMVMVYEALRDWAV